MATDKMNPAPTATEPKRPAWLEVGKPTAIPIAKLHFSEHRELPVPSRHGGRVDRVAFLGAGKQPESSDTVEILFVPWLRSHVVTYRPGGDAAKGHTFLIHESWAIAVPVEG